MPKTIPCWDCKGKGCPTCKGGGVLSVYTQEELNKGVQENNEACALQLEDYITMQRLIKKNSLFSEFDAGFEACMTMLGEQAEAIRARSK